MNPVVSGLAVWPAWAPAGDVLEPGDYLADQVQGVIPAQPSGVECPYCRDPMNLIDPVPHAFMRVVHCYQLPDGGTQAFGVPVPATLLLLHCRRCDVVFTTPRGAR